MKGYKNKKNGRNRYTNMLEEHHVQYKGWVKDEQVY